MTKRRHIDIDKVESEPNKGYKVVLMLSGEKQVIDIRCRWERSIRVKRRNKTSIRVKRRNKTSKISKM